MGSLQTRIVGGQPIAVSSAGLDVSGDVSFSAVTQLGDTAAVTSSLATVNSTPGTYGSASLALTIQCDAQGRILNISETTLMADGLANPVTLSYTGDATGGPTSFNGRTNVSTPLTLANTAVTPGTYGSSQLIPVITFDSKGRATAASNVVPSPSIVFVQTQAVTVSNTAVETTLLGTGVGSFTVDPNQLQIGSTLSGIALGPHSAVSNPTLQIRAYLNSTLILDTGVINTANSTNATWEFRGIITCLTTGVSGTIEAQGFYLEAGAGSNVFGMVNTGPITIDTTIAQTLNFTATWGTAAMGNSITARIVTLQAFPPPH